MLQKLGLLTIDTILLGDTLALLGMLLPGGLFQEGQMELISIWLGI